MITKICICKGILFENQTFKKKMLEMWKYPYVMGISTQFPYNTKVNQWIKDSALNIKV